MMKTLDRYLSNASQPMLLTISISSSYALANVDRRVGAGSFKSPGSAVFWSSFFVGAPHLVQHAVGG